MMNRLALLIACLLGFAALGQALPATNGGFVHIVSSLLSPVPSASNTFDLSTDLPHVDLYQNPRYHKMLFDHAVLFNDGLHDLHRDFDGSDDGYLHYELA